MKKKLSEFPLTENTVITLDEDKEYLIDLVYEGELIDFTHVLASSEEEARTVALKVFTTGPDYDDVLKISDITIDMLNVTRMLQEA